MGDLRGLSNHDDRAAEWTVLLNDALGWLFAHGHAADLVLAVMLAELGWLVGHARWQAGTALLRLLPGALMMLALRAALVGADWRWIALPLAFAFPVHLADLALGLPRRR